MPAAGSVTANTIAMSAFLPEVINCLVPLSTKSSPSLTALVLIFAASLPACGSVRQNAASFLPLARGFRKSVICCSLPNCKMGMQPTELVTLMMVEQAASPAAISSSTMAAAV